MGVEGYKWWLWHSKVHRRWQVNVCIDFGICQWMPKIFGYTWHNQPSIHWLYRNTWHHVAPPTTWEEPSRLPYFPSQLWPSGSGPAGDTAAASNGLDGRGRQLQRPLTGRLWLPPETPRQLPRSHRPPEQLRHPPAFGGIFWQPPHIKEPPTHLLITVVLPLILSTYDSVKRIQ